MQELREKLLSEAEQSARQNAAVAMRWADLFAIEVPQDLYDEIEKQRLACSKIIASKDKLITGTFLFFGGEGVGWRRRAGADARQLQCPSAKRDRTCPLVLVVVSLEAC